MDVLSGMGIPFFVGGSLASSIYGTPRATMNVDLVADVREDQVDRLAELLRGEFYADSELMRAAIRAGRAFNVIHYGTSYKFDIFPVPEDPYYKTEMRRSRTVVAEIGQSTWA